MIEGSELREHPYLPLTPATRRLAAEMGDLMPVGWLHRSARYGEKLATPDTSVGDLIGDVDPIRIAQGRTLGDPETIHFGLVPRSHRAVVAINELPDLAERIQVAMLNVMEERDIQIRGYVLRLPLDVLVVASANPEDYTNRGRIITPLRPPAPMCAPLPARSRLHWTCSARGRLFAMYWHGGFLARFALAVRGSPSVDPRSGVSPGLLLRRDVAAAALRRSVLSPPRQNRGSTSGPPFGVPVAGWGRGVGDLDAAREGGFESGMRARVEIPATCWYCDPETSVLRPPGPPGSALVGTPGDRDGDLVGAADLRVQWHHTRLSRCWTGSPRTLPARSRPRPRRVAEG